MTENFRSLLLHYRTNPSGRLTPMREVAAACGVSRAWVYMLMSGNFIDLPDPTVRRMASALNVTQKRLRAALDRSRCEAGSSVA